MRYETFADLPEKRKTIVCISAIKNMKCSGNTSFLQTLTLLSKEHIYCCTFRVILTLHEYFYFYYKLTLDKD